ncbi:MAG: zf-HC2 domain-containing protein [Kiritimatiellia bacterium]
MNCEEAQCGLLLLESGEISGEKLSELERHLDSCADCRTFREGAAAVTRSAHEVLPAPDPSVRTMARIRSAALERAEGKVLYFPRVIRIAAACAAALVIAAGVYFAGSDSGESAADVGELDTIMALVSESEGYTGNGTGFPEKDGNPRLRETARRLMILESAGLQEEELSEFLTPVSEPDPTAFRSRNIPVSSGKICV